MAMYDPQLVHLDKMLTNFSLGYTNGSFVGRSLFPTLPVSKQSDKYFVFGKESWAPELSDVRAPGGEAHEVPGASLSSDTFFCEEHALQIPVTDEERQNADAPLTPFTDATALVIDRLSLREELELATIAQTDATYAANHAVTPANNWSDYTNGDPIGDVRSAKALIRGKIYRDPNTMILPYLVYVAILDHPDILERIKYQGAAPYGTTLDVLKQIFEVPNILVPDAGYNSAVEGATESIEYVWSDNVVLAYVNPTSAPKQPTFGRTFEWGYPSGGARPVERWREERRGSDIIRVRNRRDVKITMSGAGVLLKDLL